MLAACCDLDGDRAARFGQQFGFARAYTDMERMLDVERPDAVCLVAPVELTCELSCRVLARGVPLLMEKPPGRTVEEIDRMIAAARASGAPNQVAVNRRFMPLMADLRHRLAEIVPPGRIQHIRYEMIRFGRRDADFATTAIHGVDAVRFLADSDYAQVNFHYQELPELGPTVANVFLDGLLRSGATAHLAFCPCAGAPLERAYVHALDHTFLAHLPFWDGPDGAGLLQHLSGGRLVSKTPGDTGSGNSAPQALMGFFAENAAFFEAIRRGRRPSPDLQTVRQSVEVAQFIRERRPTYSLTATAADD